MNMNRQQFLAEVKKYNGHYTGARTTLDSNWKRPDITPSKELVARYKQECPNNWRYLVAAFGQTRTKYDAPFRKDYKSLFGWIYYEWHYWNDPPTPAELYPMALATEKAA